MNVKMAHIREQGIDFAVFDADATSRMDHDRDDVLLRLTLAARASGLRVEKAALAFAESGRVKFYGTPDLVQFLSSSGLPRWTHTLSVP